MSKVKQAWLWFNSFMKYQFGGHDYRDALCGKSVVDEWMFFNRCTRCKHHFGDCSID